MARSLLSVAVQHSVSRVVGFGGQQCEASTSRTSPWPLGIPQLMPRPGNTQLSSLSSLRRTKMPTGQFHSHSALAGRLAGRRNKSTAAFFFLGYAEGTEFVRFYSDWTPSEESVKTLYLIIACFFSWGCCVFGSMKDPFYESEGYRAEGGNGTNYWLYDRQEANEEKAREALWREELVLEIEEKIGELGDGELKELPKLQTQREEREKELV